MFKLRDAVRMFLSNMEGSMMGTCFLKHFPQTLELKFFLFEPNQLQMTMKMEIFNNRFYIPNVFLMSFKRRYKW